MPRKAKDKEELIEKKDTKAVKKTTEKTTKKTTTAKKTATKKSTEKKAVSKKVTAKKTTLNKTAKASGSSQKKTTSAKKKAPKKVDVVEYYDLPYRYNETIVKLLAQTPNILFVYWDISDKDKNNFIKKYGEFFFNDTKPVLVVHNDTMHYSFEVDINDYASSWYLHVADSNCDYRVELGRRPINEYAQIDDYMPITSSNEMDAPNDHILFDNLSNNVYFRNVKTNSTIQKDISISLLTKIGKIYNVKDFYKTMYKDETIDFEKLNFKNMPSS